VPDLRMSGVIPHSLNVFMAGISSTLRCTTGWSKSLCAPDDYHAETRCTGTFWSTCSTMSITVLALYDKKITSRMYRVIKNLCAPHDYNTESRCTENFWSHYIRDVIFFLSKVNTVMITETLLCCSNFLPVYWATSILYLVSMVS